MSELGPLSNPYRPQTPIPLRDLRDAILVEHGLPPLLEARPAFQELESPRWKRASTWIYLIPCICIARVLPLSFSFCATVFFIFMAGFLVQVSFKSIALEQPSRIVPDTSPLQHEGRQEIATRVTVVDEEVSRPRV
jgi:hypothetical protein